MRTSTQATTPSTSPSRKAGFKVVSLLLAALVMIGFMSANAHAADEPITFESVKAGATPQEYSLDMGGKLTVWASTLKINTSNNSRQVMVYGQLGFPYSSTDIDIEEFDGKLLLPNGESFLKYNEYVRDTLQWAPEDTAGKWDKTIFKIQDPIWVRGDSVALQLKVGGPFKVKIADLPTKLDTHELEEAIDEHVRDYDAVVSRGMQIEKTSDDAWKAALAEAKETLSKAKAADTKLTQADVAKAREVLNQKFSELAPKPFNREPLQKLLAQADKLLADNGKDGKRFTKATYDALTKAASSAANYLDAKDLTTILVPLEASHVITHGDFAQAEKDLQQATDSLAIENYTPVDTTALAKVFDEAVAKQTKLGYGFTNETRMPFLDAVQEIQQMFPRGFAYNTQDEIDQLTEKLTKALEALKEIPLDDANKVTVKVTYVHPTETGPSDLINEAFKDANGQPVEHTPSVVEGQEVRIPFTNEDFIKKFDGYKPEGFSLNSEDGSKPLARVLRDRDGCHYLVFKADAANESKVASLQIKYVKGEPLPEPATKKTEPTAPEAGTQTEPAAEVETPATKQVKETKAAVSNKHVAKGLPTTRSDSMPLAALTLIAAIAVAGATRRKNK